MPAILLKTASSTLVAEPRGASLVELKCDGNDVLFPVRRIGEKLRGGIPVCAPIFGPGDSVGLNQHGFARDVEWTITYKTDATVTMTFDAAKHAELPIEYGGCAMTLTYALQTNQLAVSLTVKNDGDTSFVCSPGFHPYFPTTDATAVPVQYDRTRQFSVDELAATQFLPPHQQRVAIQLSDFVVTMESETLQRYAVWSSDPEHYICVEPTWAGNLADQADVLLIQAGEQKEFSIILSWSFATQTYTARTSHRELQ